MIKIDRIKKILESNYNLKTDKYDYFPKTNKELKYLVNDMINKFGNMVDLNNIDVSNINDFSLIFERSSFFGDVSEWDVSNGLEFNHTFFGCEKFTSDLSNWDVSNGINFYYMFEECYNFNSYLSGWGVSNGEEFIGMFYKCEKISTDLSEWNVSSGNYFSFMFYECKSFNSDLSNWEVSNAKTWFAFAENSLLEKHSERIPEKFKKDYL
jgi:surface protein